MEKKWFLRSICNGVEIEVDKPEFNVGRTSSQDLICYKLSVSREHAKLSLESGDLFVTAFKSVNGTWLNERRLDILEKLMLKDNDTLNFGYCEHPDCDGTEEHYCYMVVLRTNVVEMNNTTDLLNILDAHSQNRLSPALPEQVEDDLVVVKQEPQFVGFSNHDEVIVIDDDEDFEIACSQAFTNVLDKIKLESDDIAIVEPECDIIDIDDSDDDFDLINIVNIIESSNIDGDCKSNISTRTNAELEAEKSHTGDEINDFMDEDPSRLSIVEPPERPETRLSPNIEEVEETNQEDYDVIVKENEVKISEEEESGGSNEETVVPPKPVVDRSFVHKSKYNKPEVIEPHVITKDRVGRKRRRSISKEIEEKKKKLIEAVTIETQPSRRGPRKKFTENRPCNVRKREEPKKSITASKSSATNPRPPELNRSNGFIKTRQNIEKPKPSEDNRRNGLPQSSQSITKPKPPEDNRNNGVVQTRFSNRKPNPLGDHQTNGITRSNQKIELRPRVPSNSHIHWDPPISSVLPNLASTFQNPQPSTSSASTALQDPRLRNRPLRSVKTSNNSDSVVNCHISRTVRPDPVNVQQQYPLLERPSKSIAFAIIYWNTLWLSQQKLVKEYPPINNGNPIRMCTTFSNYRDYVKVVEPFIKFEMWDHLTKGHDISVRNSKTHFRTSICELVKFPIYQIAKCVTYISNAQNASREHPKEADIIYLTVTMKSRSNSRQAKVMHLFGVIVSCKKTKLQRNDLIYNDLLTKRQDGEVYFQLDLHVLLKPVEGEILLARFVDALVLSSATSLMRECDAIYMLSNSPVCKMILNPNINDFKIVTYRGLKFIDRKTLTRAQTEAVIKACSLCLGDKPGMYLIQGPPGTGKTTVIQHIVETLIRTKDNIRILLVAPSNASTDALVRKLGTSSTLQQKHHQKSAADNVKIRMVRLGNYELISREERGYFIDNLARKQTMVEILSKHPEVRMDWNRLQERRHFLLDKIGKDRALQRNLTAMEAELQDLEQKLRDFALNCYTEPRYSKLLEEQKRKLIAHSNIICTTLNSCVKLNDYVNKNFIDCCILDEASQSKETETLIPLMLGVRKFILVGDPQQLPAVTLSRFAKDLDYGQSLFSRVKKILAFEHQNPIKLLDVQFRMHPEICTYPNHKFYMGALTTAKGCSNRGYFAKLAPYYVFNLNPRNRPHGLQQENYSNQGEIECVLMLLEAIDSIIRDDVCNRVSVGVITPYNAQKDLLKIEVNKLRGKLRSLDITVNTVDSFQGAEKDIIILSCVRVRANSFSSNVQRLNVAVTRAKQVLYVVGTHPIFNSCPLLKDLKANAESRDLFLNVKEVNLLILKTLIEKR